MSRILSIIGFLAFAAGLVLAVVGGIVAPNSGTIILTLVILGIIVGFLNITAREATPLLLAAIALLAVGTVGFDALNDLVLGLGTRVNEVVYYFARLMAPAAVIVAVKALLRVGFPPV
jgi:hypothetical protein